MHNFVRWFIGICMLFIFFMLLLVGFNLPKSNSNINFGFNGIVETRCINGYMFVVGQDGSVRQVIDSFGKGANCDVQEVKP